MIKNKSNAGFIWGVSTSSYQVEGAAHEDGRGPGIWDTFSEQGKIANNDNANVACDHYHRYAEDIAIMQRMGVDAYRFSISWPRVLPEGRGRINEAGLAFYDRLIDRLIAAGIEPWLCLYHWDLPQALEDLGGWTARDSATWFGDFAALVGRRYGDRVKHIATFNEPAVFSLLGYAYGSHAPGKVSHDDLLKVIHNVNRAHGRAVDAIRATVEGASIGSIHNVQPCRPVSDSAADRIATERFDEYWNRAFPQPQVLGTYPPQLGELLAPLIKPGDLAEICRPIDWFGLNHYGPLYIKESADMLKSGFGPIPAHIPRTSMGWPIEPDGLQETLLMLDRTYSLPVYVMENGTATIDHVLDNSEVQDQDRIDYLKAYIAAMDSAIAAGADVRGYFVWSLLDNFEWNSGFKERFGLVHIDYATLQRRPKASAAWYGEFIRARRGKHAAVNSVEAVD